MCKFISYLSRMVLNRDDIISIQFAIVPLRKLLAETKRARRKSKKETRRAPSRRMSYVGIVSGARRTNSIRLGCGERRAGRLWAAASHCCLFLFGGARTLHRTIVCAVHTASARTLALRRSTPLNGINATLKIAYMYIVQFICNNTISSISLVSLLFFLSFFSLQTFRN